MIDLYPLLRPLMMSLSPERAHGLALAGLKFGMGPQQRQPDDPILAQTLWGLEFANPIGLAAGFDKDAEVMDPLLQMGFGFVEAGSVTPLPQPGNPRPRMFRLPASGGLINRMGFNSKGLKEFARRLEARFGQEEKPRGPVGANLGRNKESPDAGSDYVQGVRAVAAFCDYIVVNVSSPNTPGLRALQGRAELKALLERVLEARAASVRQPFTPLLVKVAPDLTHDDVEDIAAVTLELGVDGLIISNTTISRPEGLSGPVSETGGLSGRPLMSLATARLADFARILKGRVPLVGAGGVASGADAYEKIRNGASLVQLYTAFAYGGPALIGRIKTELAALLRADGYSSVAAAVGAALPAEARPVPSVGQE
ncbi:quinone-dependent dihydroorotate dehydrogenase [Radicibacter daui]|uniref:quinone-dependent dihydroorotate dehydrogenase n=1 Tax=Radicibacter daui TaxID=3064829 RepID=UPI004046D10A